MVLTESKLLVDSRGGAVSLAFIWSSLPTTSLLSIIAFRPEGLSLYEIKSDLETKRRLLDNNLNAFESMYTDLDEVEVKISRTPLPPYDNVVMEHN